MHKTIVIAAIMDLRIHLNAPSEKLTSVFVPYSIVISRILPADLPQRHTDTKSIIKWTFSMELG